MSTDEKASFLIAYDYGAGGLWGVMHARSEEEIAVAYPELTVVHERPKWMSDERYEELAESPYDIDGAPWGMLNAVLADRERE